MTIDISLLKFYQATSADGGGIGTTLMTSSVLNNEFTKLSVAERQTGTTRYSKQFLKNENAEDWNGIKVYFPFMTLDAPYTAISMCIAGSKSKLRESVALSGTATVTASGYFPTSSDLRLEIGPGEMVYNSTNDTIADAVPVTSVASTFLVLESPYFGTIGAGKSLAVGPATLASFVYPRSTDDGTCPASIGIPAGQAMAVWKRYVAVPNCPPFTNDWFTLTFEEV